ncbi:MAG: hypothetical protein J6Y89_01765 [Lachnospiraceae bacterium]|nr:hypothetical protein [Lachnospiraceae bacterium]
MFVRRTLFKRIISVTLSLTLAAGFIPLAGAFAAAGAQDEITLLTDVTVTSEDLTLNLTDGGIVYLDLDGHDLVIGGSTIGSAGDGILKIWSDQNPGQITIENSTVDVAVSVNRNDTLVMAGCTVNEGLCFESGTGALYDSRINYLRLDNSHCTSLIDVQISRSDEENGNLRSCIGELSLALALDTNGYFKDGYAGVQLHVNPGCYFSQDIRDISTGNEEVICFSTFGNYEHYTSYHLSVSL